MFAPSLRQAVEDDLPVVWLWALSEEDGVRGEGEDEAGVCVAGGHAGGASASADENRGVPGGLCRLQADCGAGVWEAETQPGVSAVAVAGRERSPHRVVAHVHGPQPEEVGAGGGTTRFRQLLFRLKPPLGARLRAHPCGTPLPQTKSHLPSLMQLHRYLCETATKLPKDRTATAKRRDASLRSAGQQRCKFRQDARSEWKGGPD